MRFTPKDIDGSQKTFTGRTSKISEILGVISQGKNVALFGERQIGKTLLLKMIRDIINGGVDTSELIDEKLQAAIPNWEPQYQEYRSLYFSVQGCANEEIMLDNFLYELRVQIGMNFDDDSIVDQDGNSLRPEPKSMTELFRTLSATLPHTQKMLILMDEMETLEKFPNGDTLADVFRTVNLDRLNLKFVYTGSYNWRERIYIQQQQTTGAPSPWNHLTHVYLNRIDVQDAKKYLLYPLAEQFNYQEVDNELSNKIIEWSGCKPLLVQFIGDELSKESTLGDLHDIEEKLLNADEIETYIRESVLEEKELKDHDSTVLKFLCHKPRSSVGKISHFLGISYEKIKRRIAYFDQNHFGTLYQQDNTYRINGSLIERYGQERYGLEEIVPPPKPLWKKVAPWILMVVFFVSASVLYLYAHPSKESREFPFPDSMVIIDHIPLTVEEYESGTFPVSVKNSGKKAIDSLTVVFSSSDVRYDKEGSNLLFFKDIQPGEVKSQEISFRIPSGKKVSLKSDVYLQGQPGASFDFVVSLRMIPFKRFGDFWHWILGILGILFPSWDLLPLLREIFDRIFRANSL